MRGTIPEQQAYAVLQLAVPDDGVAIEKPYRVGEPNLVLSLRKVVGDLLCQKIADLSIVWRLSGMEQEFNFHCLVGKFNPSGVGAIQQSS